VSDHRAVAAVVANTESHSALIESRARVVAPVTVVAPPAHSVAANDQVTTSPSSQTPLSATCKLGGESDRWSSMVRSEKQCDTETITGPFGMFTRRRTYGRPLNGHSMATGFIVF
jgi:hypothetical protein